MTRELCECSWDPFPASSPAEIRASGHDRGTHVAGSGECLAKDSYGLRCSCRGFVPMDDPDDEEDEEDEEDEARGPASAS